MAFAGAVQTVAGAVMDTHRLLSAAIGPRSRVGRITAAAAAAAIRFANWGGLRRRCRDHGWNLVGYRRLRLHAWNNKRLDDSGLRLVSHGRAGIILRLAMLPVAVHAMAMLAALIGLGRGLGLRCHDDAVVMLRVLEIVLRHDGVAGGSGISRECHILFGDMRGSAAIFTSGPLDS